ncbi:hypothetical protein [Streptomyces sp. McG3]|uniref:TRADD-N-associated membrane domain-containing protein n=1 Tax=Streptomyces sp. McG3 TaxID=2725483 RepID=UPI002036B708|nr:hypothetical protein [Streptomyces sp. McG3]
MALTVVGVVLMETVFDDRLPEGMPEPISLLPTVALMLTVAASITGFGFSPGESEAVGESRQRLTRAEGALADAIRREYTEADIIIGGSLMHSRDTPLAVDPELEPGHGQPATGEAGRRGALGFPELWEATHARLDLYHQIATGQAKTSFRNAQIAMGAGFLLLILFAGIALWASTTAVAIVAGGLGAVSAALAGYVAKTFIRSQEAAATHLRSYFDQPLELSRYLAAERLVADGDLTQEQRGEILTALVQAMVAGPQPPPAPQSVVVASVPGQPGA